MRLLFALPLLGLAACSQLRPATPAQYADVNAWAHGRVVDVVLATPQRVLAANFFVVGDSATWVHASTGERFRVATSEILRVEDRNAAKGRQWGLAAGAAVGAAVGVAEYGYTYAQPADRPDAGTAVSRAALGAVVGSGLGWLVGVRRGPRSGYTFAP